LPTPQTSQNEIVESFEQTHNNTFGHQRITHTYTRVDQLLAFLLQLHYCEILPLKKMKWGPEKNKKGEMKLSN
jgi:hypothetical protein